MEPKKDFLARSLAALNRVRREYEGQTVVVAAHGMLIAMTMTALVAERHPELLNEDGIYPIPVNASLTEVPLQYLDDAIDRWSCSIWNLSWAPRKYRRAPRIRPSP